jgi:hypothetical protein
MNTNQSPRQETNSDALSDDQTTSDSFSDLLGDEAPSPGRITIPPTQTEPEFGGEDDPSNLETMRTLQDYGSNIDSKKVLRTIPVRKPSREWFVRVHPDLTFHARTHVLESKEDREFYLVAPSLWSGLPSGATFVPRLLVTTVSRQGTFFLWPIRLPGIDGRTNEWNQSSLDAAKMAQTQWVQVASNMQLGAYDITVASCAMPEPEWPELPFQEIIRIAFRDRMIRTSDHPVLRRLRGEV